MRSEPEIEAVGCDLHISPLPMWLAMHQELKTSLKIRRAMDFLRDGLAKLDLS